MFTKKGPHFFFIYLLTLVLGLMVLLPVVVVVLGVFSQTVLFGVSSEQWAPGTSLSGESLKWFRYVFHLYGHTLLFSLKLSLLSVAICLLVGVPGGYVLAGRPFWGSRVLEELLLLPLSIPGIAIAIGLINAYSVIRGRWELILAGHLLYTLPFMVRAVTNTLRSFDVRVLERAAQSLGAGFFQRFRLVILPSLRHAMILGSLLVFAISWGEFNVSFLLNTPLNQTFPAALYATYTSNSFQVSSAATTLFLAVVVPVILLLQWVGGHDLSHVEQGA